MDNSLISRQAVIDGLVTIAAKKCKGDPQKALMGRAIYFVEHLPSIQQTVIYSNANEVTHIDHVGVLNT